MTYRVYRDADNGDGNQNGSAGQTGNDGNQGDPGQSDAAAAAAAQAAADAAKGKTPTDAEAKLLKEVMQKKEALAKKEADLAAAQARLKEFDGVDPAAIKKLLADQAAAEEAQLAAAGDFDRLKARMVEEHTKSTKTLQDQITALQAELAGKERVVDDLSVGQQFAQSKFIGDELTLTPSKARTIYGNHFDVVDGKVVAFDKPRGEANRTALVDQYGNGVGFEDALRKIVEADPDKDHLLKSKVKPGAGSESKTTPKAAAKATGPLDAISKIGAGLKLANLLVEQK